MNSTNEQQRQLRVILESENNASTNANSLDEYSNVFYKGWILTNQDLINSSISTTNSTNCITQVQIDGIKWVPKFAVLNRSNKSMLLYDYEPTSEYIKENFNEISSQMTATSNKSASSSSSSSFETDTTDTGISSNSKTGSDLVYRIDASIRKELFINYWRNRISRFELNLADSNEEKLLNYHFNRTDGGFGDDSAEAEAEAEAEREMKEMDKIVEAKRRGSTVEMSSGNAFRFAGLFFSRKDKSEKTKHSSLKRAKSGIQLERKLKPTLSGASPTTSSKDSPSSNRLTSDYESRNNNLPSPMAMRVSRSHEYLGSPSRKTVDIEQSFAAKLKLASTLDTLLRLNLIKNSSQSTSKKPVDLAHKILTNKRNQSATSNTPLLHNIHNSLFNEECCFELKCLANSVTISNAISNKNLNEIIDDQIVAEDAANPAAFDEGHADEHDLIDEDETSNGEFASTEKFSLRSNRTAATPRDKISSVSSNASAAKLLKYQASAELYSTRFFMCRSGEERDKWLQCLRQVMQPQLDNRRHEENALQVWILEAKGVTLSGKPSRKYFCEVCLNRVRYSRTSLKDKREILFWGENFEFAGVVCDCVRVELYEQTTEVAKSLRKSKKDKEKDRDSGSMRGESSREHGVKDQTVTYQTLVGYVNIPVKTIDSSQPTERWYRLEGGLTSTAEDHNSAANVTSNFSKDAISIRIKAKYQSVDILPLACYKKLIDYLQEKYLSLTLSLEPCLSVRLKDDLANSLVRVAHKLQISTRFLTDLITAEVMELEDVSLTFRGNSLATKAIESYMKLVGETYLKNTLSDCVRYIIDVGAELEIDPSKVTNPAGLEANRDELVQILHVVCGRVFNSFTNFPVELRLVFASLRRSCLSAGKTDEMVDTLVSACVFLRLICPAILSPNLFNLTQEYPQEKAARKLTLTAKTLQTIANFSKFGGKEFYMSFDRMNEFVDEHTLLMREFLRNISTFNATDEIRAIELSSPTPPQPPILTLTPQTPKTSSSRKQTSILINHEVNFNLDLIDLGKQLSIVHSLLVSILASIDEDPTKQTRFDLALVQILSEIVEFKKSVDSGTSLMQLAGLPSEPIKLYSYENRLHQALMRPASVTTNRTAHSSLPTTPTTPPLSNMSAHEHPTTSSDIGVNMNSRITSTSSSSSSKNSSEQGLNCGEGNSATKSKALYQQKKLEDEIVNLKQKLRETELSLKKEQTEKYLIEFKLKQQQLDNDQQMRSIINRLIKVEEELRKEQNEMHKLLKAKQDLIEIQKKRIEFLQGRPSNSNTEPLITQIKSNGSSTSSSSSSTSSNNNSNNHHNNHSKSRQVRAQSKPQSSSLNDFTVIRNSNPTQANHKSNDRSHLIAASPSFSSSSIYQFCTPYINGNSNHGDCSAVTATTNNLRTMSTINSSASSNLSNSASVHSNYSSVTTASNAAAITGSNYLRASEL